MLKLSVVIPAHNEESLIGETLTVVHKALLAENIDHELVVINDNSKDDTENILAKLSQQINTLTYYTNPGPHGFGYAVRYGLERFTGDCVAVMMADLSDDPADLIHFYRTMIAENVDCVFGSRFIKGGKIYDYPRIKLWINRTANMIIRVCLGIRYNDTTNAFKLYKRSAIEGVKPFLAPHFNLTIELPLKAIVRGYSYKILPNSWRNREATKSNLDIREMGSRYLFILLYVLIEKFFTKGDFKKKW
ncbi:family 2 glycosyl transferase [Mucilaginibacter sp. PPCGB 2223]|uniref:glycosyltransferase family 2 protein n=1 Tax=Mucilaginibacter sp. PPCGB 2223 TaxID=1886027 RepID=UPI0008267944|nr:glycosyltransferase family 2 protein [Mucilaginibacter sp. PPCGB 2223]OCX52070.1 family 2 glycosyl transferase [Mucilaginibacter sp. PPCGB 2223]